MLRWLPGRFSSLIPRPAPDKNSVSAFLRQAEDILEIASIGGTANHAIVIDRQGGMRMLDPTGWSLPGLAAEFGASAVYRIQRRGSSLQVEGFNGKDRCLLSRGFPMQAVSLPAIMS